ncbi:hypothetical protein [Candidatus Cyanaurora vandensis]|uniref:hypothetical protein n=1 Tax=Candidatus Cyanaurora vandensis TaxID=2714958 RepID=UPI00257E2B01|nr:hypothetical protein [Candidatus Cyanaurora vandensis]
MQPFIQLHIADVSLRVRFSVVEAVRLDTDLRELMERIKQAQANRKQPQAAVEYRQREPIFVEVYGNPNLWPSPFAAKVLVTLKSTEIQVSGEAELTRLLEDVQEFLVANRP